MLSACAAGATTLQAPPRYASDQPAFAAAQATLVAGEAERVNLANQSTQVALNLIQAQATQDHFIQQTAYAAEITVTAKAEAAQATATAFAYEAILAQTQAVYMTQTAHAIQSATAWPQTATPQAATQIAIVAQAQTIERRAYWSQIMVPFWAIFKALIGLLTLLAAIYLFKRLLPALILRSRTIISPDGEMITFLPEREHIRTLLPGRAAGPVVHADMAQSQVSGLAPEPSLQENTLARHQAIRMASVLPTNGLSRHQLQHRIASEFPDADQNVPVVRIIENSEQVPMLDDETLDILEGQWRTPDA